MWSDQGLLIVNESVCHQFLECCLKGEISLSGNEPPVREVLEGRIEFVRARSIKRFKATTGCKFVNAISDLLSRQRMVLGQPSTPKLRDFGLIRTWLANLCNAEADQREK